LPLFEALFQVEKHDLIAAGLEGYGGSGQQFDASYNLMHMRREQWAGKEV
jgi:hypothetical protein